MTTDPVELLIQAGAIPSSPFGPNSRYAGVPLGQYQRAAAEPPVTYVLRRFIPQRREFTFAGVHVVRGGERPELLAAVTLGDPEQYYRIADANAVTDPFELTDSPGRIVSIPLPAGF